MPTPDHMNHHEQSEALRRLLAEQKPKPRWQYRLERVFGPYVEPVCHLAASVITIAAILVLISSCATRAVAAPLDVDRLIPALERVESGGDPAAIGDNGRALGILQIWDVVIADVNRAKGTTYTHRDALDPVKARAICRAYLSIYCTAKRLGRAPTMEDAARIWNGGPSGWKKKATEKYWQKVSRAL